MVRFAAQRMIRARVEDLQVRAENFVERVQAALSGEAGVRMEIADGFSLAGGGSTPDQTLATKLICIGSRRHSAAQIERSLRSPAAGPSVIARVEEGRVILDLRTVFPEQETQLSDALVDALS